MAGIEVFLNDDELRGPCVGLVMVDPGIVEWKEALAPGCVLTARQAHGLAAALNQLAEDLEA